MYLNHGGKMKKILELYTGLLTAWPTVIDFKFPQMLIPPQLRTPSRRLQLAAFPLLGGLCGLLLTVLCCFTSHVFNPVAGGFIFAVLVLLFLEAKDSGRGLGLLLSFFLAKVDGFPWRETLPRLSSDPGRPLANPLGAIFLSLLEICKLLLLFSLALFHAPYWITVVLCGSFAMQAYLMMLPQVGKNVPFLAVSPDNRQFLWYGTVPFGLVSLLLFPFGTIAAIVFFFIFMRFTERVLREELQGVTADMITFAGTITEHVLLLIGIFLAIHKLG